MNTEQEDFEELRRLLVLKRYEQPPPGYFNGFSSQVIARIEAGEASGTWFERLLNETPWLQQLRAVLGAKPALAGGFGLALCGVLVAGLISSEDPGSSSMVVLPIAQTTFAPQTEATANPVRADVAPASLTLSGGSFPQSSPSLFEQFKQTSPRPLFQRVEQTYVVPNGN